MAEQQTFLSMISGSFATPAAENPTVAMMEAAYEHHQSTRVTLIARWHQMHLPMRCAEPGRWVGLALIVPFRTKLL